MNNQDIIGRYGEGMKLGILALNRLNKNVTIISEKKIFNFYILEKIIISFKIINL